MTNETLIDEDDDGEDANDDDVIPALTWTQYGACGSAIVLSLSPRIVVVALAVAA